MFEIVLHDKLLTEFGSHCNAALAHSDTVLLKITSNGICVNWTDAQEFAFGKIRIRQKLKIQEPFSTKILLDSLINLLRNCGRSQKGHVRLSISGEPKKLFVEGTELCTAEHRDRKFYLLSVDRMLSRSQSFCVLSMQGTILDGLVSNATNMAGSTHDGKGEFRIFLHSPDTYMLELRNTGDAGMLCVQTMKFSMFTELARMVRFQNLPVTCNFSLAILNRSRAMMNLEKEAELRLSISELGFILQSPVVEHVQSAVMFSAISDFEKLRDWFS